MATSPRERYVQRVLYLYRRTPGTRGRARPSDRALAENLHDQGTPLDVVQLALLLAVARRHARPKDAPPLPPIASLHYFLPIINEITQAKPHHTYRRFLRTKLAHLAPDLVTAEDHHFP